MAKIPQINFLLYPKYFLLSVLNYLLLVPSTAFLCNSNIAGFGEKHLCIQHIHHSFASVISITSVSVT